MKINKSFSLSHRSPEPPAADFHLLLLFVCFPADRVHSAARQQNNKNKRRSDPILAQDENERERERS